MKFIREVQGCILRNKLRNEDIRNKLESLKARFIKLSKIQQVDTNIKKYE